MLSISAAPLLLLCMPPLYVAGRGLFVICHVFFLRSLRLQQLALLFPLPLPLPLPEILIAFARQLHLAARRLAVREAGRGYD